MRGLSGNPRVYRCYQVPIIALDWWTTYLVTHYGTELSYKGDTPYIHQQQTFFHSQPEA